MRLGIQLIIIALCATAQARPAGNYELTTLAQNFDAILFQHSVATGEDQANPSESLVGVFATNGHVNLAELALADSPEDVTISTYTCSAKPDEDALCEKQTSQTRCFYYAETGQFSVVDFKEAFVEILKHHAVPKESRLGSIKLWQVRSRIYGIVNFDSNSTQIDESYFECHKGRVDMSCVQLSEAGPGQP